MKKNILFGLTIILFTFSSCNDDDGEYADYLVARPLVISKTEFARSVAIVDPIPINESGKIYAYEDYIFINDKYQGVHVINNSNPESPQKVAFIKIPGNIDISVKGNFLYADSITDLIVLDISNINEIKQVNRLEGVLRDNVVFPAGAEIFEWGTIDYENDIVVGWETVVERRKIEEVSQPDIFIDFAENANDSGGNIGQGGSLARFKIVDDYLYAVDSHTINVFEISDLANPLDLEDVYAGFDIETIFNRGNHLFLGSMRGMYIYDITSPATPEYVSEFQHGTACDPVVVDDNYAYVTLRGGNFCGATESGLFIVDISTIENPELKVIYPMDEPYGLGIKDDKLFVCDGASGLKVYNKSNVPDLPQLNHFKDIVTFDVIPMDEQLLMIGDGILYQYKYLNNDISLISEFNLN
ncbi:LVIVD repeat-containing protein [uncultured Croceitalea sp.]|uniref:LVIVD repeat-containing protein n=1 Tax=uncultured Croceitalea sp. TaxID=1798908 RepID=UPI00374EED0C